MEQLLEMMTDSSLIGNIPSILVVFFGGYIFDIFGRRWTLFLSYFLYGIFIFLPVLTAPSVWAYNLLSNLFSLVLVPCFDSNPIVMDCALPSSYAKANSLTRIGYDV